jgi:hypothetical protein
MLHTTHIPVSDTGPYIWQADNSNVHYDALYTLLTIHGLLTTNVVQIDP